MKDWSAIVLLAALAIPATAAGQRKPSRSMQTRSAEIYLDRANNTAVPEERKELLQKALGVLLDAADRDGDNPLVWKMAGQAYARLGDAVGADSSFDRAERLYPEYAPEIEPERIAVWILEYNAGIAAIQAGDPASAIQRFETADRIHRGRPDAVLALGSLYAQSGDLAKAEAAYRAAIEIARGPAAAKVPEAEREAWAQEEEAAAMRLADLLAQLGRTDDAIATYRGLVASQPQNPRAQSGLAAVLAKAGKNDEAATLYRGLLGRNDLSDIEWFNAGVGLYSAANHTLAMQAFEKSLEVNPWSRDALYNLGQAVYGAAAEIEKERAAAPEAGKAAFGPKLVPLYEKLAETANRLREMDPAHRSALMMLAQAQRSLGELTGGDAAGQQWREKVLATLQMAEDMPFEVGPVETQVDGDAVTISGPVTNLKAAEGSPIVVVFELIGEEGAVIATETVRVTAPAAGERARFEFEVKTDKVLLGWRYKVTG